MKKKIEDVYKTRFQTTNQRMPQNEQKKKAKNKNVTDFAKKVLIMGVFGIKNHRFYIVLLLFAK